MFALGSCSCVCVCVSEREREREREKATSVIVIINSSIPAGGIIESRCETQEGSVLRGKNGGKDIYY